MTLTVPDHIGFCTIQDRIAILDASRNRYFTLPLALNAAFRRFVGDGDGPASADDLQRLLRRGLLADGERTRVLDVPTPTSSYLEDGQIGDTTLSQVLRVGRRLFAARRAVERRPFAEVVKQLDQRRARRPAGTAGAATLDLCKAVSQFLAARRFVPIAPVCLHDSLALLSYLEPLGFYPTLVFGVALDPFSAHCWVQADGLVLNDALHRARSHTPILAL
ncbi:lasso peptide biosynthesis B2 protein [Caulobacter sp.]|uniref:lasso peptide biosynthesis B2 protein n=1 Tax=Caulobacter sp. TaxID=78 RepID=UPI001B175B0F|nr:lasso peptide biosynthesis B2 protein [Caulobacter sp.]MBO9547121.1 lasso peptide biosynthesis B2 protein [Caulobacter sp.]